MLAGIVSLFISLICLKDGFAGIQKKGKIEIRLSHFAGREKLVAGNTYKNAFDEPYTVGRFKYYITNITVHNSKTNSDIKIEDSYFLVYDDDELSKTISIAVEEGEYSAISFLLGVDSLHNVSGAQTGALDPMNGMFWTWNTGYVSMKLEGRSPLSSLPGNLIEYHLGGFKGPDNVNRRISLSFPRVNLTASDKRTLAVNVKVDVNLFFSSVHQLPIKSNPACTSTGSLARQYSENYAALFSIISAINE